MKYYRLSYDEIVSKRAYINIMLLNAAIPGSKPVKSDDDNAEMEPDKKIHANEFFTQFM